MAIQLLRTKQLSRVAYFDMFKHWLVLSEKNITISKFVGKYPSFEYDFANNAGSTKDLDNCANVMQTNREYCLN